MLSETKRPIEKKATKKPVGKKKKINNSNEKNVSFLRIALLLVNCIGGIVFLTLLVLYLLVGTYYIDDMNTRSEISQEKIAIASKKIDYRDAVITIQGKYHDELVIYSFTEGETLPTVTELKNNQEQLTNILNELVTMTVPADLKIVHEGLFTSYGLLSQSTDNLLRYIDIEDKESEEASLLKETYLENLDDAELKINYITIFYPWIKTL